MICRCLARYAVGADFCNFTDEEVLILYAFLQATFGINLAL